MSSQRTGVEQDYSSPPVNRPCIVPLESFIPTISTVFPNA
ncbi:protein of unknown function [Microbacterium sp. Nx66]|nr:protein of unknown function [Microbacterium sp. Nx66]